MINVCHLKKVHQCGIFIFCPSKSLLIITFQQFSTVKWLSLACFAFLSLEQGKTLSVVCKCLDYGQSCIRYGHFTPRSQITLKIVWSRPWKLSPNKRQLHNINSNKYQSSGATTAPRPKLSDFANGNSLITSLYFEMANGKLFFHAKHNYLIKKNNPMPAG